MSPLCKKDHGTFTAPVIPMARNLTWPVNKDCNFENTLDPRLPPRVHCTIIGPRGISLKSRGSACLQGLRRASDLDSRKGKAGWHDRNR